VGRLKQVSSAIQEETTLTGQILDGLVSVTLMVHHCNTAIRMLTASCAQLRAHHCG